MPNDYTTRGTIINSDGVGMVTIDNPALGRRLRLDMHNPLNARRSEEIAAPEAWVDFSFGGTPEHGSYEAPFNTLQEATSAVPAGGIVKLLPGSQRGSFFISKAMTLTAPQTFPAGVVTLGR